MANRQWSYEINELDQDCDRYEFANPGGRSSLRSGRRIYPCPTCGKKYNLTAKDRRLGYQCDKCADELERGC
jgi:predicted RNA-binding Zn-ribbon protein involved in translation (DUF1610 family)